MSLSLCPDVALTPYQILSPQHHTMRPSWEAIRSHPFFASINWKKLESRGYDREFKPKSAWVSLLTIYQPCSEPASATNHSSLWTLERTPSGALSLSCQHLKKLCFSIRNIRLLLGECTWTTNVRPKRITTQCMERVVRLEFVNAICLPIGIKCRCLLKMSCIYNYLYFIVHTYEQLTNGN
jgi:hypothetical protein